MKMTNSVTSCTLCLLKNHFHPYTTPLQLPFPLKFKRKKFTTSTTCCHQCDDEEDDEDNLLPDLVHTSLIQTKSSGNLINAEEEDHISYSSSSENDDDFDLEPDADAIHITPKRRIRHALHSPVPTDLNPLPNNALDPEECFAVTDSSMMANYASFKPVCRNL